MNTLRQAPDLRALLAKEKTEALRKLCTQEHPAAVAGWMADFAPGELWQVLQTVAPERQAAIVCQLPLELQAALMMSLEHKQAAAILTAMSPDDRADIFRELDDAQCDAIFPALAQAAREDIRRLTAYPEGTAGGIMSSDYVQLTPGLSAAQALDQIRLEAPDREVVYYAYVLDEAHHLLGAVSLKDLIVAKPETTVDSLMKSEVIVTHTGEDQEIAARMIRKYDLLALPVVNEENVLVGIITHDDAMDVIVQEQQEDLEKLMAISGDHEAGSYLKTPALKHFKNRASWVVGLAALGLVSGLIIHNFEDSLTELIILALYMPMVADTGGNTGSQAATVVVRALALGEITTRDVFRVLFKELKISALLALVLAVLSFGKVMFLSANSEIPDGFALNMIGTTIAVALGLQVVTATLIGAILPLGAAKFKLDPAVVASPALTTIVDITGLLLYFYTAKLILGL